VGVKARLLVLWHQSLAHNEKARSWTRFSKVKEGDKEREMGAASGEDRARNHDCQATIGVVPPGLYEGWSTFFEAKNFRFWV